eukprot:344656-Lingulodinium_polyedra.AAC.1
MGNGLHKTRAAGRWNKPNAELVDVNTRHWELARTRALAKVKTNKGSATQTSGCPLKRDSATGGRSN